MELGSFIFIRLFPIFAVSILVQIIKYFFGLEFAVILIGASLWYYIISKIEN